MSNPLRIIFCDLNNAGTIYIEENQEAKTSNWWDRENCPGVGCHGCKHGKECNYIDEKECLKCMYRYACIFLRGEVKLNFIRKMGYLK